MLGESALDIIRLFSTQGHSGMSAAIVTSLVGELMQYQPLTPLTYGPEEWTQVTDDLWQNKRKSSTFSVDGGKTHYDLNDLDEKSKQEPLLEAFDSLAENVLSALGAEPGVWA